MRWSVPECVVRCYECPPVKGSPRKWRWLCRDCAEECQQRHREQTGHRDVQLILAEQPSIKHVQTMISRLTGRGW